MTLADLTAIGGFVALFALLLVRVPIGVALGLVGLGGFAMIRGIGPALNLLASAPVRTVTDFNLTLVPFFILMGILATNSGMSREMFRAANSWFGQFRGGLALSTVAACGGFSAICGSSVATAATMTKVALPEMRRHGYREDVATGVIAAGGTLGSMIPPSVILVIYAYITENDVGQLFIAGVIPGLLAVLLYMGTILTMHRRGLPAGTPFDWREALAALAPIWAVTLLFIAVIGVIYTGIATPTEAAAVGAFVTLVIGVLRGRLSFRTILDSLIEALRTSVSVYTVLIGAVLFGYFLAITRAPQKLTDWLVGLDFSAYGTLGLILLAFILAGCILDTMAMILLLVPIVYPVVISLGFDPIWFGIIVVMVAELGMISPPVGINVFVINTIARDVKLTTIFRGVIPFIFTDLLRLVLLIAFPALVLWLPSTM
ncbi:Sialic acid TRAP transporter permease protein SiaT [Pseudooceanicola marinus]|uniref:TRAP transporter large permease protein n=1 Tax=Pseudooceanicola marinus TaxID=396013 RepID=A0A1X6YU26_9RHOB|nr:TRAP transporter large permease [Pseudooceanicola marinus]PJE26187.1 TRAP transporter large permease [Pseudooceanicola marinus]SLN30672.1 Sialic acid TRAP transporter permease protein SiaT [Pseudooceanicola marinus]